MIYYSFIYKECLCSNCGDYANTCVFLCNTRGSTYDGPWFNSYNTCKEHKKEVFSEDEVLVTTNYIVKLLEKYVKNGTKIVVSEPTSKLLKELEK